MAMNLLWGEASGSILGLEFEMSPMGSWLVVPQLVALFEGGMGTLGRET